MKVVGVVKSIVGTDAVIAIDEDGNQRAIFPGDNLYDNEKLLELSGVQVNVEPVTEAPIVQPVAPTPSEPAHISDNIFEITRMYTDEDSDLRTSYTPSYPNTTAGFDFKPTFEGKAEAFVVKTSTGISGSCNPGTCQLYIPCSAIESVISAKADANGNWKVESGKDYDHGAHKITADVTHTDGSTYHSSTEMFYMPTDPFIVEPVDHL